MILGERTGETGDELVGHVCTQNRGVIRLRIVARGRRAHTGLGSAPADLLDHLIEARTRLGTVLQRHLTLNDPSGWQSSVRFPFLSVGEVGVYNISAGSGSLGIEIRPIPQDDIAAMMREVRRICADLELHVDVMEGGVECPRDNPHLASLLDAVRTATGSPARVSRKRPGTSARFAPGGNAVVWGQTGIGPHSRDERHFIPSIEPYLEILDVYADRLQMERIHARTGAFLPPRHSQPALPEARKLH